ncbi:MAG: type IV pilus biogenesis/stability protein PilW [Gammaproteobacteria bacterium]|nr:type IV pilus biogenesis/stability protein PilW [Gammaproteobacteria bacterium]
MNNRIKARVLSLLIVVLLTVTGCVTEVQNQPAGDPEKYLATLIKLGVGYLRNGDYQRSKEKLQTALKQDSKSVEAHTTLGLLYQIQLEDKLAEKHFKKAIGYDSENAQARLNYGAFLFTKGRYKEAIEHLTVAAEDTTYRNQPQAYENLAVCYAQMGDNNKAEQFYRKALGLNPRLSKSLLAMSEMKFNETNYMESLRYYRAYLDSSQQTARSLWLGIRLAKIFGNKDEEQNYGMVLEKIFPGTTEYKQYKESLR